MRETWTVIDNAGLRWCNADTGEERTELRATAYPTETRMDACGVTFPACWTYYCEAWTDGTPPLTFTTRRWRHHIPSGDELTFALSASDSRLGVGATAVVHA